MIRCTHLVLIADPCDTNCDLFFFTTSYNDDQLHSGMGPGRAGDGYRRVFLLFPNSQRGDAANRFKSRFQGEIVDDVYVPLTQLDFSAELANIAVSTPDAVSTFMRGDLGTSLVRQYRQAGLARIPSLSTFTTDVSPLPAIGAAAAGLNTASLWGAEHR